MRHGKKFNKLGRPASHRRAMLRNMVTSLFAHHSVKTTLTKAKETQKSAERLIRYAITGTLADKRRIISYLKNREVAHELIRMGQEKFADRPAGGHTAIYHIATRRKGDGAEMAMLKLLTEPKEKPKKKKKKRTISAPEVIETVEALEEEVKKEEEIAEQEKNAEVEEAEKMEKVEEEITTEEIDEVEEEPIENTADETTSEESETNDVKSDTETDKEEEKVSESAENSPKIEAENDSPAQEPIDAEKNEASDEK